MGSVSWIYLGSLAAQAWAQPITYPVSQWNMVAVGFDQLHVMLEELLPSHPYEAQIRAVDTASPPNYGNWSYEHDVADHR